jgi:predicted flap endonuclease-1-like 5' DNA nuclease
MALLQKLKEALGFESGSSARESGDPTVTVEKTHEAIDPAADETDGEAVPEPSSGGETSAAVPAESPMEPVEEAETNAVKEAEVVEEAKTDDDPEPAGKADAAPTEDDETVDGDPVEQITGIGPAYGDRLAAIGIETVDELADANPAAVADETSISEKRATTWIDRANEF